MVKSWPLIFMGVLITFLGANVISYRLSVDIYYSKSLIVATGVIAMIGGLTFLRFGSGDLEKNSPEKSGQLKYLSQFLSFCLCLFLLLFLFVFKDWRSPYWWSNLCALYLAAFFMKTSEKF